ncbi:hypothetical protein TVAG_050790 [Trichomonas vaginalis G3]|uniref:Uncharacterized protein n=1 Tax=Trichomonas vaginalis (strain ATCC PRA-98 / G3) TaxID=412133 RepID=A2EEN9_TRIV3|nr:armadillo (ARM) repeat-containing protein family [Trichomonas vaginalis G3]EAY08845.1 hypothetical protein TVAG_050790 [Trichomonas vaginalis G3]KAI5489340.1 armadillo (ARM) repeat-containing protein family [Trichomonas vaginalis G3]|eukprot:XP_001321068.1 hypothetical protein [Trichomonas vaginalis G3]
MEFFEEVKTAINSDQNDILTKTLISCYTKVNYETFAKLEAEDCKAKFEQLFDLFSYCGGNENENIRLMAYRACAFFLVKCGTYFLPYLLEMFYKFSEKPIKNEKSSIINISVFAFFSEYLPCHQILELISKVNIIDLFNTSDPVILSYIPNIVKHFRYLGTQFHKNLLLKLIEKWGDAENMYYFQCVHWLLTFSGEEIAKIILEKTKNIGLINFVYPIAGKYLQTAKIIELSINILQNEKSSIGDLDCALQLLSSHLTSANIQNQKLLFSISEKNYEFPLDKITKCPSLYRLPLPIDQLKQTENDSGKIFESKFNSIGKLAKNDVKHVQIFIDSLSKPYNNDTTFILQALSQTIKDIPYSDQLALLLQQLLYSKHANWYNTVDILSVIASIKDELLIKYFGYKGLLSIMEKCVGCVCSRADSLVNIATTVATKISSYYKEYFQQFTSLVAKVLDYTDDSNLGSQLDLLTAIINSNKQGDRENLLFVVEILLENYEMFTDNLVLVSSIFRFISKFPVSNLKRAFLKQLFLDAVVVVVSCYRHFSGNMWQPQVPSDRVAHKYDLFSQFINSQNVDVTFIPTVNDIFKPFESAVSLVLAFNVTDFGTSFLFDLIDRLYPIFPSEVINFIYQNFPNLDVYSQVHMLQDISYISWSIKEKEVFKMTLMFNEANSSKFSENFVNLRQTVLPVIDAHLPYKLKTKYLAAIFLFKNRDISVLSEKAQDEVREIAANLEQNYNKRKQKIPKSDIKIFSPVENNMSKIIKGDKKLIDSETTKSFIQNDLFNLRLLSKYSDHDLQKPFYIFDGAKDIYERKASIEEIVDKILKAERPKKKDVLALTKILSEKEETEAETGLKIFDKMLSDKEEVNRIRVGLLFAYKFAIISTKAGVDTLQLIFDTARQNYLPDEVYYYNRLFSALVSRGVTGETPLSYTPFPGVLVFEEKIKIFQLQRGIPYTGVFPARCFNEQLPSNYMCALRVVIYASSYLSRSTAFGCLKDGFNSCLKTLQRHKKVYCGGDLLCSALSSMFNYTELSDAFVWKIPKLEISTNEAIFSDLCECFPLLFASRLPGAKDYEIISGLCNKMLFSPPCKTLFDAYISSINARVDITSNPSVRDTIVSDPLLTTLRNFELYDCYWCSEFLFEWLRMIVRTSGIVQTMSMLTIQFVKYVPRFANVFVAGVMLLNEKWPIMTDEEIEQATAMLNSARVAIPCKCHAAAFVLLGKRENMKLAIKLASADRDTEETDKIVVPILDAAN